jgi:hypothetical protein
MPPGEPGEQYLPRDDDSFGAAIKPRCGRSSEEIWQSVFQYAGSEVGMAALRAKGARE